MMGFPGLSTHGSLILLGALLLGLPPHALGVKTVKLRGNFLHDVPPVDRFWSGSDLVLSNASLGAAEAPSSFSSSAALRFIAAAGNPSQFPTPWDLLNSNSSSSAPAAPEFPELAAAPRQHVEHPPLEENNGTSTLGGNEDIAMGKVSVATLPKNDGLFDLEQEKVDHELAADPANGTYAVSFSVSWEAPASSRSRGGLGGGPTVSLWPRGAGGGKAPRDGLLVSAVLILSSIVFVVGLAMAYTVLGRSLPSGL